MTNRSVNMWVIATATGIVALGLTMLFIPTSAIGPNARLAGWVLLGAGVLELAGAAARRRLFVRRIELLLGCVTVGAALLILLRPEAFALVYVAITCLLLRGVGAVVAAALSPAGIRIWVMVRGLSDLALGLILLGGAPLAAVISVISGNRWPDRSGAVLTNFVALSMLVTGLTLLALALTRKQASDAEEEAAA